MQLALSQAEGLPIFAAHNLICRVNTVLKFFGVLLLAMSATWSLAQDVVLTGTIIDAQSSDPIPYATVVVIAEEDGSVRAGTTTDDSGAFSMVADVTGARLEVSFIGFFPKTISPIPAGNPVDLGTIALDRDNVVLDNAEVTAEKSTVEFKLDKRVFNVGKDISSTGMGALDVLDNVPSVNVDIEGNVTLRGQSGVQILINGKPSVLSDDGSNALGTITADMIESVEVITNPSAKYEAEGTSGILNIILKKDERKGFNGSMSANTGWPHNHSLGGSMNLRTENFNFFTQFGAGYRSLPTYRNSLLHDYSDSTQLITDGIEYRDEQFYNITLGADYYLNPMNTLTLSGSFAYEIEQQPSETTIEVYGVGNELLAKWGRREETSALNPKYQYDLQYEKKFQSHEDHVLLFSTQGKFFGKDQESDFTALNDDGAALLTGQQTSTDFFQADYIAKADYTNPLSEKVTIEAGGMYELNDVGNDFMVVDRYGEILVVDSGQTNNFEYDQSVLGVYGTGSYEGEKWGIKLGLRVEQTDLKTLLTITNEANNQNYTNYFPTVHTSLKLSEFVQLQAGYSRRIFRPRLWDLNPFFNIRNNFNIRQGNPELLPEFGDSYEVTGIFIREKLSMSASVYHLYTTDKIVRVTSFQESVSTTKPLNIGSDRSTGVEVTGKYTALKWLTLTGEFNYGFFRREGEFEGQNFDFEGDRWSSELTAKAKMKNGWEAEVSGEHQSDVLTVQGMTSGYTSAGIGLRKKISDGKWIVDLSVRDVFASRIRESIVEEGDTYFYSFSQRGRFLRLGVSYSFGKGEAMTYTGRRH